MNLGLEKLHPYPFERLAELKQTRSVCYRRVRHMIDLSIGEPKHITPKFILDKLHKQLPQSSVLPNNARYL